MKKRKVLLLLTEMPLIPILILTLLILVAFFAQLIAPYPPTEGDLSEKLMPPAFVKGGSDRHLLGTDFLGRDGYSRLLHGARISLTVAVIAIFVAGITGTFIGLVSGYFGGWVDALLMRITDIGLAVPLVLMAVVMAVVLGPSFQNIIIILSLLIWPRYARQIRGEALSVKEQDFVALAKIANITPTKIIIRHILPNVIPTLLVLATLQVGWVILLEASLSFLGVGIPPPTPAWGLMVAEGRGQLATAWWVSLFPGLAILVTVLSLNLLGDWVRDRLDPKLRQV